MTDDLDWLAARQPVPAAPDPTTTAAARAALLDHVDGRPAAPPPAAAPFDADPAAAPPADALPAAARGGRRRRDVRRPRRRVAARAAALSLATAAAVTVAAVGLPFGASDDGDGGGALKVATDHGLPLLPASADAAPLRRLSARVAALPDQPGDATLSIHTNRLSDGNTFTGADLYLDDGTYYYAPTAGELRGISGETPIDMPWGAIIAATRRAATLGPEQARAGFLRAAEFREDVAPPAAAPDGTPKRAPSADPPSLREREDNMIWVTAIDVLAAGGSRPDVRAGVLRLLATVPAVTLDTVTLDGRRLLRLRSQASGRGYHEVLYLDADSGVMQRYVGGASRTRPDVVVTYAIERVEAAQVLGR